MGWLGAGGVGEAGWGGAGMCSAGRAVGQAELRVEGRSRCRVGWLGAGGVG